MYDPAQTYIRLPLQNSGNVRDLGGYPAADGRVTQFKRFLRSGTLAYLTKEEIDFLLAYGVTTIIDLRTEGETVKEANPFRNMPDVSYMHLPLFIGDLTELPFETENMDAIRDMYKYMFIKCGNMVAKAISAIAAARDGIILYHCSAGKDRTGILSYILLALCGVSEEDVLANYQVTETYYLSLFKKFAPDFNAIPIHYLRSDPEQLEKTMRFVESEYGGVEAFLLSTGVTQGDIERIRERLL